MSTTLGDDVYDFLYEAIEVVRKMADKREEELEEEISRLENWIDDKNDDIERLTDKVSNLEETIESLKGITE